MGNVSLAVERRKQNFRIRDERICQKMNFYYHEKRIRYDDCLEKLADDFCLQISTIRKILKQKSPE